MTTAPTINTDTDHPRLPTPMPTARNRQARRLPRVLLALTPFVFITGASTLGLAMKDEQIDMYGCRPGQIELGSGASLSCIDLTQEDSVQDGQDDHDDGDGPGGAAGGQGQGTPLNLNVNKVKRDKCLAKADRWRDQCNEAAASAGTACLESAFKLTMKICTRKPAMGVFGVPVTPCFGPVSDWDDHASDGHGHQWEDHTTGFPVYVEEESGRNCTSAGTCGGDWLKGWQGGAAEQTHTDEDNHTGSFGVKLPFVEGGAGGGGSNSDSVTIKVDYETKAGLWRACGNITEKVGAACLDGHQYKVQECWRKFP